MNLPVDFRAALLERLEIHLARGGTTDPVELSEFVILQIEEVADELEIGDDEVISSLEASGELESSLEEVLQEAFETSDDDFAGEDIVGLIERLCDIEWKAEEADDDDEEDDDDDEMGAGFFDDDSGMFEEDE